MSIEIAALFAFPLLAGALAAAFLLSWRWVIAWFAGLPIVFVAGAMGLWDQKPQPGILLRLLDDPIGLSITVGYLSAVLIFWLGYTMVRRNDSEEKSVDES